MHSSIPPAVTPVATSPAALRFARPVLSIIFGVVLTLLIMLAIASAWLGSGVATGVGAVGGAAALILLPRYLLRNIWARLGVRYAVLACVLAYLAADEATIRRPLTMETIAPAFSGAEESFAVLMRYGKNHPLGHDFQFQPSPKLFEGPGVWKPKDPQWTAWITRNRAELESGWAKLEPVRSWWTELNTFERIGDLTAPRPEAEIVAFQPIRALCQHACAIASLKALDGNGDAAMEILLPVLEVSRKLEPSSRTLVRSMVARVVQKMALETATFVLDTTAVSPAARTRFASALAGGITGEEGARRLVVVEYAWATAFLKSPDIRQFNFGHDTSAWPYRCLQSLGMVVYNPRRTINLYGEMMTKLQDLAARRASGDIDAESRRVLKLQSLPLKNFAGPLLLSMITPAYGKIMDSYWTIEDLRLALQTRLQA